MTKEELHKWYWDMEDILVHNYKLFMEYGKNNRDIRGGFLYLLEQEKKNKAELDIAAEKSKRINAELLAEKEKGDRLNSELEAALEKTKSLEDNLKVYKDFSDKIESQDTKINNLKNTTVF